jgi:hypothetical protein
MVLAKPERHHGTKIMNINQMATNSKNDPTTRPRNASQDGNGPMGKTL